MAGKEKGQKVVCSLMLDEMSIHKHAQYDGKKVLGYVDLGAGITDDSLPVATKALDVYMAVSVNSNWKIPCSLVDGLTGEQKARLTKDCLRNLH